MFGKKQRSRRKAKRRYARISELERNTRNCDSLIEAVEKK
jgi:hypothetical protein